MKKQNNKTRIATTVTAALMIGLIMLSPMTVLPNVSAQSNPEMPSYAVPVQHQINEKLKLHPNWIGILSWNGTAATIDYLGPASDNPFKSNVEINGHKVGSHEPVKESTTVGPLTSYKVVKVMDSINGDRSGSTSEYKVEQYYTLYASSTTGVDLFHWLSVASSGNGKWLQVSAFYDKAGFFGSAAWRADWDIWTTSGCTEDSGYPSIGNSISWNANDAVTAYIRADATFAGQYTLGVTDTTNSHGTALTQVVSGDTGHNVNLGRPTGGGCGYPSGTAIEEDATSPTFLDYYGTLTYTYGFYDTSTSSKTTSVTGFNGKEGSGGSISVQNSPAQLQSTCTTSLCP